MILADLSDLKDFVEKDHSKSALSDFMNVMNGLNAVAFNEQQVLKCAISDAIVLALPEIGKLAESVLFRQLCWNAFCNQANQDIDNDIDREPYSSDEIFATVWKPAREMWLKLCQQIEDETITFDQLDQIMSSCDGSYDVLNHELHFVICDENSINKKMKQIREYMTLENYSKSALILNKARKALHLEVGFDTLELLCSVVTFPCLLLLYEIISTILFVIY